MFYLESYKIKHYLVMVKIFCKIFKNLKCFFRVWVTFFQVAFS